MKEKFYLNAGNLVLALILTLPVEAQKPRVSRGRIQNLKQKLNEQDSNGEYSSVLQVDWERGGQLSYRNETKCNEQLTRAQLPTQCTADYIIVGLGNSGAVTARYLTEDLKSSVVVIHQGYNQSSDPVVNAGIDQGVELGPDLKYRWKYGKTTHNIDSQNGLFLTEAANGGRVWGGSSATNNNFLSTRAATDFNDALVAASGNSRWSYAKLLPFYKFIETFLPNFDEGNWPVSSERGTNGPLYVSQLIDPLVIDPTDPLISAFTTVTSAQVVNDLSVSSAPTGLSSLQAYIDPNGNRSYSISAFLPSSILNADGTAVDKRRKLRVVSPAYVLRIIFVGNKAVGVEYIDEDANCRKVFARKQVILAAGAPGSAQLLLRSGVGPSADLNAAGVKVVVDNPNVGKGLKIQYGVMAAIGGFIPDYFINLGAMIDGSNSVNPNQFSNDGVRRFQVFLYPFNAIDNQIQTALNIQNIQAFTIVGMNLNPSSTGFIKLISKNPFQKSSIQYALYTDPSNDDLNAAVSLFNIFKDVSVVFSGFNDVLYPTPSDYTDPIALQDDAKAVLLTDDFTVQIFYGGTCNMGTSIAAGGVVDGNLKVFGTQNLMVADNSILPLEANGDGPWQAYTVGLVAANILGFQLP